MAADYPATLPDLLSTDLLSDYFTHAHKIKILEELDAVIRTLDTGIAGSAGSVAARLTAIETQLAGFGNTGARALYCRTSPTTPNSQVIFSADLLGIEGSIAFTPSAVVDITAVGKNGLEMAGIEGPNVWYYVWCGYNPMTGESCGMLSLGYERADLILTHASLAGFTKWRRVSAVRNDASSHFVKYRQQDSTILYDIEDNGAQRVLGAGTATTMTTVSCQPYVPPTSRLVHLSAMIVSATAPGLGLYLHLGPGDTAQSSPRVVIVNNNEAGEHRGAVTMPLDSVRQVAYKLSSVAGTTTAILEVWGYEDTI